MAVHSRVSTWMGDRAFHPSGLGKSSTGLWLALRVCSLVQWRNYRPRRPRNAGGPVGLRGPKIVALVFSLKM